MVRVAKGLAAVALTAGVLTVTAGPAEAVVRDYRNCDHMHSTFKNGVAKSERAARQQVRSGHARPAVRLRVYRANIESDADRDGTACEVSR